jgi:hypothetical protein
MNLTDLATVLALTAAAGGVAVALTGQRHFLERAVNPHRLAWLLAAVSVFGSGVGLLRWEAKSSDPSVWGPLLGRLVSHDPTPPSVKAASVALLLGVMFAGLVAWSTVTLPRDPSTFRRPQDQARAVRYYGAKLWGGLDYALLFRGDGSRVTEAVSRRRVESRVKLLPPPRTLDDQVRFWRETASRVAARLGELDALIEPAGHGHNRQISFDTEFCGFFFRVLEPPGRQGPSDTGLYLFAATLDQGEMDNLRAERHFRLLLEALRSIDRGIRTA